MRPNPPRKNNALHAVLYLKIWFRALLVLVAMHFKFHIQALIIVFRRFVFGWLAFDCSLLVK